jgi:biotin carboxyl carrier protein
MKYIAAIDGREFMIEILDEGHILVDGQPQTVDFISVGGGLIYSLLVGGESFEVHVYPEEDVWQVIVQGSQYTARVEDERERRLKAASGSRVAEQGEIQVKAPMPGLVVAIPVQEGDEVKKGDVLVVLESMKMQNELKAPRDGMIERIRVAPRDSVEQKQTLLTLV